jgi:hypothetical protein
MSFIIAAFIAGIKAVISRNASFLRRLAENMRSNHRKCGVITVQSQTHRLIGDFSNVSGCLVCGGRCEEWAEAGGLVLNLGILWTRRAGAQRSRGGSGDFFLTFLNEDILQSLGTK